MVKISTSSCKFLLATIDDIFDISRLELNQFQLNKEWFCLRKTFEEVNDILGVQAEMKGIDLKLTAGDLESQLVFSDEKRIKQILFNLIGNALKFTKSGQKIRVATKLKEEDELDLDLDNYEGLTAYLSISVEDNG